MITGIVGLDLSMTCTGYARLDLEKDKLTIFTIKTNAKKENIERCHYIAVTIRKAMQSNDLVFIEDYAYGVRKASQLATLGELNGMVKYMMWKYTGRFTVPTPIGTWKKFLCNKGNLNKDGFKLEVFKKFNLDLGTNDECAAIAICDFGACIAGVKERDFHKYELDKMKEFRKKYEKYLPGIEFSSTEKQLVKQGVRHG